MKSFFTILTLLVTTLAVGQNKYEKDFDEFWNDINSNYAYIDQQQLDWNKVKEIYQPQARQITNDYAFIRFLENVINELHNGHISLNTNLKSSNRLIPSGQDIFVEKINDKFLVTDIRKGFGADLSGLKIGDEIVLFNDKSIEEQIRQFLPQYTSDYTKRMYQFALNMLFAGTHDIKRKITVDKQGNRMDFFPDTFKRKDFENLIEIKTLNKSTAYIKINNSLSDLKLIDEFDKAVDNFMQYKNLVIDLTETPGGGNTTVARCIMGRFISKTLPYQQHEFDEKRYETQRKWVEYVVPRKTQYKGNVFIAVGHWTGSMGEGMAIGFDGMKRAKIIGSEMAGLLGAIRSFTLTETKIGFQIPTERLYHINGTAREEYKPMTVTKNIEETIKLINGIK